MLDLKATLILSGVAAAIIAVLGWQLSNRIEEVGGLKIALEEQKDELAKAADANVASQDVITELETANRTMVSERAADAARTQALLAEREKKFKKAIRERDLARRKTHDIFQSTEGCQAYGAIVVADVCPGIANELRERAQRGPRGGEAEDSGEAGGGLPAAAIESDGSGAVPAEP